MAPDPFPSGQMLDTVGIQCGAPLLNASLFRPGSHLIPFGKGWKGRICDGWLMRVEGSLKHYNDGRLPETEAELDAALSGVFSDIAALADAKDWKFYRLDLARDVPEPTAPLVRACRQFRFPIIRKAAEVADDDASIRWGSRRCKIQVQIYDAAKKHRMPSPASRLEIRLLSEAIATRELQREASWAKLEAAFLSFAVLLPDVALTLPTGRLETGQAIACLGQTRGAQAAQDMFKFLTQGRSRPTVRKVRKQMNEGLSLICGKSPRQAFTLPRHTIGKNLSTILPADTGLNEPGSPPPQAHSPSVTRKNTVSAYDGQARKNDAQKHDI